MSLSIEQQKIVDAEMWRMFFKGMRQGVTLYAHWRDGVQYVGTTGKTLNEAIESINKDEKEILAKHGLTYHKV